MTKPVSPKKAQLTDNIRLALMAAAALALGLFVGALNYLWYF